MPYLDPLGTLDGTQGQLAVATAPGSWTVITNVTPVPIHAGGFAVFGTDWFLSGAADEPDPPNGGATVWRSTDSGATWTVSLAPRPDLTNMARFHLPVVIGDVLQVFDSQEGHLYEWDGATWTDHGTVAPLNDVSDAVPYTYNGTPFALCLDRGKDTGVVQSAVVYSRTRTADDATRATIDATLPINTARDACTDGTHLYLLGVDGTIWRGDTTGTWTGVVAPVTGIDPRSLAVLDGIAYLGTADSKLFSLTIPA